MRLQKRQTLTLSKPRDGLVFNYPIIQQIIAEIEKWFETSFQLDSKWSFGVDFNYMVKRLLVKIPKLILLMTQRRWRWRYWYCWDWISIADGSFQIRGYARKMGWNLWKWFNLDNNPVTTILIKTVSIMMKLLSNQKAK